VNDWIQRLVCILLHAPRTAELINTDIDAINEVQGGFIPIWDHRLGVNRLTTSINANGIGRFNGRAFGVSNIFGHKRSVVTADFEYSFAIDPSSVIANEAFVFKVDVMARGRFQHFPAVSSPGDNRQPPAMTFGLVFTRVRIAELNNQGQELRELARSPFQHFQADLVLPATQNVIDVVNTVDPVELQFTPTGQGLIVFDVIVSVQAAATGGFSDIRVGALDSFNRSFQVSASNARVQKVMPEEDFCRSIFS